MRPKPARVMARAIIQNHWNSRALSSPVIFPGWRGSSSCRYPKPLSDQSSQRSGTDLTMPGG